MKNIKKYVKSSIIVGILFLFLFIIKLGLDGFLNPINKLNPNMLSAIGDFLSGVLTPLTIIGSLLYFIYTYDKDNEQKRKNIINRNIQEKDTEEHRENEERKRLEYEIRIADNKKVAMLVRVMDQLVSKYLINTIDIFVMLQDVIIKGEDFFDWALKELVFYSIQERDGKKINYNLELLRAIGLTFSYIGELDTQLYNLSKEIKNYNDDFDYYSKFVTIAKIGSSRAYKMILIKSLNPPILDSIIDILTETSNNISSNKEQEKKALKNAIVKRLNNYF